MQMIEESATHVGVAAEHVIESFRNDFWLGYKTGRSVLRTWRVLCCALSPRHNLFWSSY
jgi:hypothetical protein